MLASRNPPLANKFDNTKDQKNDWRYKPPSSFKTYTPFLPPPRGQRFVPPPPPPRDPPPIRTYTKNMGRELFPKEITFGEIVVSQLIRASVMRRYGA